MFWEGYREPKEEAFLQAKTYLCFSKLGQQHCIKNSFLSSKLKKHKESSLFYDE